jgi:ABC-type spermidine/putrescine transport system permease subunit I
MEPSRPVRRLRRTGRRWVVHPLWFVVPLSVIFVFAYLVPLGRMASVSLFDVEVIDNLRRLWDVPLYRDALLRTVRVAASVAVITVVLAYPVAWFISGRDEPLRSLLLALLLMTVFTSIIVRSYVWITILRPRGILDGLLGLVGVRPLDGALFNNEFAVLIGMVHILLPLAVLPIYAAFRRLDPLLPQAAASLGASRPSQWSRIIVPLTMPSVVAAGVLVFLAGLGFYVTPAILGGPRTLMIGTLISNQILANNLPFAGLVSIALLVATVLVLLGLRFVASRFRARGLL